MLRLRLMILGLLALLTLAGCGGADVDPAALAQESATKMEGTQTFHFVMDVTGGSPAPMETPLGPIAILGAEGDVKQPSQLKGSLKAQNPDLPIAFNVQAVLLEGEAYMTNPLNPAQWEKLEDATALSSFSPAKGVADVLRALQSPTFVGTEDLNGVQVHHISGKANPTALAALTGGLAEGGDLTIDIWIGVNDKLPYKLMATGPIQPTEPAAIKRALTLSAFGQDVTITAPE